MWRNAFVGFGLVLATIATFLPVVNGELLQWDDDINIYNNPHIQKLNAESLQWMFTDCSYTPRYRPLNWLSWAVLYHFFGTNGGPYHWALLVLHAVNAVLLFALLLHLLKRLCGNASPGWQTFCALGGALVWAVHPLRAEVVGWANCQMYTQSLFFLLVSALAYLVASTKPQPLRTAVFWGAVGSFLLSLLTYPTGIGFLAVLVAVDIWLLRRLPESPKQWWAPVNRGVLLEKVPFLVATAAVGAVTLWARLNATTAWATFSQTENFGWVDRASQAFYIWAYFLWKPFLPHDLAPVYIQLISFRPTDWPFLASAVFVVGASLFLFRYRVRLATLFVLWMSHLALLVPMLGLTDHPHYPNDRYGYVVGILWASLMAGGLAKLAGAPRFRFAGATGVALVAAGLGVMSFQQSRIWKDSVTLFETTIARLGENSYRADILWRLGLYHAKQGRKEEALRELAKAVKINRGFPEAHNDMATILFDQGKVEEAMANYEDVLRIHPTHAATHRNYATVLQKQGRMPEAADHFAAAIKSDPRNVEARLGLAFTLQQAGRMQEAFDQIFTAVETSPDSADAQFFAGNACMNLEKVPKAMEHFGRALKLQPSHVDAHQNLGAALATSGKIAEALPHFAEAARLRPEYTEAHFACAMALEQMGKAGEATQKYRDAFNAARKTGRTDLAMQIQAKLGASGEP